MYHTDGSVAMTKEGSEADHNTGQANYMEKKALPRQRTEGRVFRHSIRWITKQDLLCTVVRE